MGCTSVGQHRIPSPGLSKEITTVESTVIVIVAEGLRQDTFARHLRSLIRADNEPNFRSGLSLLALDGFKFASSNRAEGPVAGTPLSAAATLATARSPGEHGIVGSRFIDRPNDGPERLYNLSDSLHSPGQWYTEHFSKPSATQRTLLSQLTLHPTWISRLAKRVPVGAAFHVYGQGANWHIPKRRTVGSLALVHSPTGALAVPLLDRESQKSATSLLLNGNRLVVVPFRQTRAASCHRSNASCDSKNASLKRQQDLALQEMDEALWHMVTKYRAERPGQYKNATIMLVGTHGVIDRARDLRPNRIHVIARSRLLDQIGAHLKSPSCIEWFQGKAKNQLRVVEEGAVARLYLPDCRPGQCSDETARLCLSQAISRMTQTTQWIAGAMWLDTTRVDGGPRGLSYRADLRPAFGASIRAYRRERLLNKMRRSIDTAETGRTGDAVLFASSRWTFGGKDGAPYAHEGGLADAAMNIPFFIANRALTDAAPSSIRIAPLELMDVGPTVYSLLGIEAPKGVFTRPPVVKWRAGSDRILEFVKADRKIAAPRAPGSPKLTWHETRDELVLGVRESRKHWPPDSLSIEFGDTKFAWTTAGGGFPKDAPCQNTEDKTTRRWSCRFKKDSSTPSTTIGRATRDPGTGADDRFTQSQSFTTGFGSPTLKNVSLVCATAQKIRLKMSAEDQGGLGRIDAFFARDSDSERTARGNAIASVKLGQPPECSAADTSPRCSDRPSTRVINGLVDVPLSSRALKQLRWSDRLVGRTHSVGERLRSEFKDEALPGPVPRSDWLVVRVCNRGHRCARQRLVSDRRYAALVKAGCPKQD